MHDITLTIIEDNGKTREVGLTFKLSSNWANFCHIFHISDIQDRKGNYVIPYLKKALEKLQNMGYEPNRDMRVDTWGNPRDRSVKSFSHDDYKKDRHCMFAHLLNRFLEEASKYPEAYWHSDEESLDGGPFNPKYRDDRPYRNGDYENDRCQYSFDVSDDDYDNDVFEDDDNCTIIFNVDVENKFDVLVGMDAQA